MHVLKKVRSGAALNEGLGVIESGFVVGIHTVNCAPFGSRTCFRETVTPNAS